MIAVPPLRTAPIDLSIFPHLKVISYHITYPPHDGMGILEFNPFGGVLCLLERLHPENKVHSLLLTVDYPDCHAASGMIWLYDGWGRLNELLSQRKYKRLETLRLRVVVGMIAEEDEMEEGLFVSIRKEDLRMRVKERLKDLDEAGILIVHIDVDTKLNPRTSL
jgi:hypothetical protein